MTSHPSTPRFLATVVLLSAMLGLVAEPAAAAAGDVRWTVQTAADQFGSGRPDFRYTLNPGGHIEDGIVVVNQGATPLHLALEPADGVTASTGRLDLVTNGGKSGVGAWARPERDAVTVGPGESAEVPFTIALPKDAAPGDYVGGIVAEADGSRRAAVQVRLRVGGALKPSLSVENVRVSYAGTANPIGKGEGIVTYTVHNTGNAILTARQTASVSGPFGRWKVAAGKIADTPPLLPGEKWKVSAPLQSVTPALRLTATVTLIPLLTDAAGSTAPLTATKTSGHAVVAPWSLLVALVVVCGLLAGGLSLRSRRRVTAPAM
jgi:hypothetical protein